MRGEGTLDSDGQAAGYRVEVDTEPHHFPAHGAFSFWSAVKSIFILSLLLWWLPQNLGAMVAGYVGGRRAGSHWKAALAALVPVLVLYVGQWLGEHHIGPAQIAFVSNLPSTFASSIAAAIPPAQPYLEFLGGYFATFLRALQTTFGMQANGYLIVVVFAYIGGIVGEQGRRELGEDLPSTSINIVQPVVERLRAAVREDRRQQAHAVRSASPVPFVLAATAARRRRTTRGREPERFSDYHRVGAVLEKRPRAHEARPVRAERPDPETRPAPAAATAPRDRERDLATQRFVERALAHYGRPHRPAH